MRWTLVAYRQHPKAATTWLLHDSEEPDGQVAVFHDRAVARSVAAVLNLGADVYDAELHTVDPHRGAF